MSSNKRSKFYESWWFIFIMLFMFTPLGIILLCKNKKARLSVKVVVSILFCFYYISFIGIPNIDLNLDLKSLISASKNTTSTPAGILKVHFIDVGQADAVFMQLPNKQNILIDAGNNDDSVAITEYLTEHGIRKLDYVIGTHPHEDHIGSLDTVIDNFDIEKIYMPKISANTKTFKDVLTAVKNKGLKISTAKAGISLIDDENLSIHLLAPNSDTYDDTNNYSVVTKISFGTTHFLVTGDAEDISEKEMLAKGYNLKSNVLKVGHHGSNSSTTQAFLKAVSPQFAVIMCGKDNKYGHPHQEILQKLKKQGIKTYRTDEAGTIIATSDGNTVKFMEVKK